MSQTRDPDRLEPDADDPERVTWLRAVLCALRRRVDAGCSMATWRARVPRPFELEALLSAVDPTSPTLRAAEVARALGISPARARAFFRHAQRIGALAPVPPGSGRWALTPRGRALRGELEIAQAAALRDVARGTDPAAWAALWRAVDAAPPIGAGEPEPAAGRACKAADPRTSLPG